MDLNLSDGQRELQARAYDFVRNVLQRLEVEVEFERASGRLPVETRDHIRRESIAAGLVGGSLPRDVGGQAWTMLEQVLVHEQLGQGTGGLWSFIPGAGSDARTLAATATRGRGPPRSQREASGSGMSWRARVGVAQRGS